MTGGMLPRSLPEWRRMEWTDDARCGRRTVEYYDIDNIPYLSDNLMYWVEAQSRCAGCPVMAQCAAEAIKYRDKGVIRAGQPLANSDDRNDSIGMYERLEEISKGRTVPIHPETIKLKSDEIAKCPVLEGLPSPDDPTPVEIDGDLYVNRVGAAQILGIAPRTLDNYRHNRILEFNVVYYRRKPQAGTGSTFFLLYEIEQAKEQISDRRKRSAAIREAAGNP